MNRNELMSKMHKKICTTLNYIEHFLILVSTITGWVSISAFASLTGILIGIYQFINIIHDEFVSINNMLKEYKEMKEGIKNLKT